MIIFLISAIFIALIITTIAIINAKDLVDMVVLFSGFGLFTTILFFLFSAPDVALTEVVIGVGVSGVVFYLTILKTRNIKTKENL